jgi:hypothetical protein
MSYLRWISTAERGEYWNTYPTTIGALSLAELKVARMKWLISEFW